MRNFVNALLYYIHVYINGLEKSALHISLMQVANLKWDMLKTILRTKLFYRKSENQQ